MTTVLGVQSLLWSISKLLMRLEKCVKGTAKHEESCRM